VNSNTALGALLFSILLCLAILIACGSGDGEPTPQATAPAAKAPAEVANAFKRPSWTTPSGEPLPPIPPEEIEILTDGLLKPELSAEVRVWTLWQLHDRTSVENDAVTAVLRAVLEDPEPEVAAAAAVALRERGALDAEASPATPERAHPREAGESVPPPGMRVETLD
jgi:hypothetical protein